MEPSGQTNALLRARLDELMGEYERAREQLTAARQRMRTLRGSAQTTDGTVRVAVDAQGRLVSLEIEPRGYRRYSPSQLADEILTLAGTAVADVQGQLGEVFAPFLPAGVTVTDLVDGNVEEGWPMGQPVTDATFDAWRARFRPAQTDPDGS